MLPAGALVGRAGLVLVLDVVEAEWRVGGIMTTLDSASSCRLCERLWGPPPVPMERPNWKRSSGSLSSAPLSPFSVPLLVATSSVRFGLVRL
uniref:Putative secreted protein n=1 Tax=Anopheles triannulatus TaxID=58253 RepID=A0A2M4B2R8_9DIPT